MDVAKSANTDGFAEGQNLSDRDREILEFERQWWKYAGAKEQAVREKFDMSSRPTRCWSVGSVGSARPGSASAQPADWASRSDHGPLACSGEG